MPEPPAMGSYGEKREQGLRPFYDMPDSHPDHLMTPGERFTREHDGIVTENALDFLS